MKQWLSISDCVKASPFSDSTIRKAIKEGSLRATKPLGKYIVRRDWFDDFLESGFLNNQRRDR